MASTAIAAATMAAASPTAPSPSVSIVTASIFLIASPLPKHAVKFWFVLCGIFHILNTTIHRRIKGLINDVLQVHLVMHSEILGDLAFSLRECLNYL